MFDVLLNFRILIPVQLMFLIVDISMFGFCAGPARLNPVPMVMLWCHGYEGLSCNKNELTELRCTRMQYDAFERKGYNKATKNPYRRPFPSILFVENLDAETWWPSMLCS